MSSANKRGREGEGRLIRLQVVSRGLTGNNRTKRDLVRLHALAGRMFSEISRTFIQLIIKQTGNETQETSMLTIILICLLYVRGFS